MKGAAGEVDDFDAGGAANAAEGDAGGTCCQVGGEHYLHPACWLGDALLGAGGEGGGADPGADIINIAGGADIEVVVGIGGEVAEDDGVGVDPERGALAEGEAWLLLVLKRHRDILTQKSPKNVVKKV